MFSASEMATAMSLAALNPAASLITLTVNRCSAPDPLASDRSRTSSLPIRTKLPPPCPLGIASTTGVPASSGRADRC